MYIFIRCKVHYIKMLTEYERDNYEGAGLIFMTPDLKLLLVKEKKSGKWGMCKGHRERKDKGDPTATAIREAYEELGVTTDDYELQGEPFVMHGSPKIYVFQYAILKVDIVSTFTSAKIDACTLETPRKLREIVEIKLVPYIEWMQGLEEYNSNVYVRLFQAYVTGTYSHCVYPKKKKREEEYMPVAPVKPRRVYYNSQIPGGSPIQPMVSPIVVPDSQTFGEEKLIIPDLNLNGISNVEDVMHEIGRLSPTKGIYRERTESSNSLYDDRASPFVPLPYAMQDSTWSTTFSSGGGAGGYIEHGRTSPRSPRTCIGVLLPQSPSPRPSTPNMMPLLTSGR